MRSLNYRFCTIVVIVYFLCEHLGIKILAIPCVSVERTVFYFSQSNQYRRLGKKNKKRTLTTEFQYAILKITMI